MITNKTIDERRLPQNRLQRIEQIWGLSKHENKSNGISKAATFAKQGPSQQMPKHIANHNQHPTQGHRQSQYSFHSFVCRLCMLYVCYVFVCRSCESRWPDMLKTKPGFEQLRHARRCHTASWNPSNLCLSKRWILENAH